MRIFGRRFTQHDIEAGSDQVIHGFPLPAGGRLNNVFMEEHIIGPEGQSILGALAYGVTGFVVPVPDPDDGSNYDTLWDNLIPKDVAAASGAFDLDTEALDTTSEVEFGLPDLSGLFEVASLAPHEIFRRRKFLSLATSSIGYTTVDAGADLFTPTDYFRSKVAKGVSVRSPSVVLFGFSSPAFDVSQASPETIPTEPQWILLQYMEQALEQMFIDLIGLTETGAESPYEESTAFIADLLEAAIMEDNSGAFTAVTWRVFSNATYDISVPGRVTLGTISSES